jgi:cyclic beta-1,2-glucan synthetase
MNVTVRNVITSMRLMSAVDWAEFFESVSLADDMLRAESNFADMDFPTRDRYRHAIEELARGSGHPELEVARRRSGRRWRRGAQWPRPTARCSRISYCLISKGAGRSRRARFRAPVMEHGRPPDPRLSDDDRSCAIILACDAQRSGVR